MEDFSGAGDTVLAQIDGCHFNDLFSNDLPAGQAATHGAERAQSIHNNTRKRE